MFILPGWLVSILTFPGVMLHEAAHKFFCDLMGVRVMKVCYFRVGNPAGYVIHETSEDLPAIFLVSVGPLIVNTLFCSVLTFAPVIAFSLKTENLSPVFYLLAWVGISMGMHAFPSNQDTGNLIAVLERKGRRGPLYFLAQGFRGLIFLANLLRIVWFDIFFALGIAWLGPHLLLHSVGFGEF